MDTRKLKVESAKWKVRSESQPLLFTLLFLLLTDNEAPAGAFFLGPHER
jgi:hypothetical protein